MCNFFKKLFNKKTDEHISYSEPKEEYIAPDIEIKPFKSNVRILIDNGHGKNTSGKRSPYSLNGVEPQIPFEEWSWNREIANMLYERLLENGYNATIIVPEENDILLYERVMRVNDICDSIGKENVILISIHGNAAGMGDKWMSARGWSAYTTKGKTKSDNLAECLYDAAYKNLPDMKIREDMSDGDKDQESNFYLLRKTKCPAVLSENFFYDNIYDVQFMLSDEGKERIVQTHIDGIVDYLQKKESL